MSTEVAKKSGSGYAWLVMVGFGMVMCATIGAITVMGGLFYYPVCEELGFDLSSFTLYVTLSMVFMALGMPICGKIMASGKIKLSVLMTVAVLLELVPFPICFLLKPTDYCYRMYIPQFFQKSDLQFS